MRTDEEDAGDVAADRVAAAHPLSACVKIRAAPGAGTVCPRQSVSIAAERATPTTIRIAPLLLIGVAPEIAEVPRRVRSGDATRSRR
jgi:hypothetical protein